jgi:two-component system sensor histidine kinase AtoS
MRIDGLMKSILNFARPPKPNLLLVDINSIMDSTIELAERHPAFKDRSGREITVFKDFDHNLPDTQADPMQLQQVFLNLLLNAADAMPDQGFITVQTSYAASDRMLHLRVTDTGKGIDGAIIGKIFQPFFTTKPNGTGLGLAIIKGLVEQHGGTISVRNNEDRGVTFNIALPIRTAEVSAGAGSSHTETAEKAMNKFFDTEKA